MAKEYMKRVSALSIAYGTKSKIALDGATKGDPGYRKLKDGSIEIDVSKAKSALTVCGLYETTAFHQAAIPQDPEMKIHGQAPKDQVGRTFVADYKYMMAGTLYARDFDNWK